MLYNLTYKMSTKDKSVEIKNVSVAVQSWRKQSGQEMDANGYKSSLRKDKTILKWGWRDDSVGQRICCSSRDWCLVPSTQGLIAPATSASEDLIPLSCFYGHLCVCAQTHTHTQIEIKERLWNNSKLRLQSLLYNSKYIRKIVSYVLKG